MKEGKAIRRAKAPRITQEEAENLFSMLDYLEDHNRLEEWASEHINPGYGNRLQAQKDSAELLWKSRHDRPRYTNYIVMPVDSVAKYMGYDRMKLLNEGASATTTVFTGGNEAYSVKGYDFYSETETWRYETEKIYEHIAIDGDEQMNGIQLKAEKTLLLVFKGDTAVVDLKPVLANARKLAEGDSTFQESEVIERASLVLPEQARRLPFKVKNLEGVVRISALNVNENHTMIDHLNYAILYRRVGEAKAASR